MTSEMPAFEAAAARVRRLHDERAALLEQLLAAEDELIRQAAAAHRAGTLDPWGAARRLRPRPGRRDHRIRRALEKDPPL